MDLAFNNPQRLICHKIQPTNQFIVRFRLSSRSAKHGEKRSLLLSASSKLNVIILLDGLRNQVFPNISRIAGKDRYMSTRTVYIAVRTRLADTIFRADTRYAIHTSIYLYTLFSMNQGGSRNCFLLLLALQFLLFNLFHFTACFFFFLFFFFFWLRSSFPNIFIPIIPFFPNFFFFLLLLLSCFALYSNPRVSPNIYQTSFFCVIFCFVFEILYSLLCFVFGTRHFSRIVKEVSRISHHKWPVTSLWSSSLFLSYFLFYFFSLFNCFYP